MDSAPVNFDTVDTEPVRLEQAPELVQWMRLIGAGVAQAQFAGFDANNRFLVVMTVGVEPQAATSTIGLGSADVGAQVVVTWEGGDATRPIIIGRLCQRTETPVTTTAVRIDGDRLLVQAEREIELRCGESSIVLTRAGKVLIRGSYVLSRSRGANRVKGAYVDIN